MRGFRITALLITLVVITIGGTTPAQARPLDGGPLGPQTGTIDAVHNNPVDFILGGNSNGVECFTVTGNVTQTPPSGQVTFNGTSRIGTSGHPITPRLADVLRIKYDAQATPTTPVATTYHPLSDDYAVVPPAMSNNSVTFVTKQQANYTGQKYGGRIKLAISRTGGVGGQLQITVDEQNCSSGA